MAISRPTWSEVPSFAKNAETISAICLNGYTDDDDNHCAHFVGHALGIAVGYTCKAHTGGHGGAASLRVHEVFKACAKVGLWANRPSDLNKCLIFITNAHHVDIK